MSEWRECKLGDVAEVQTGPFGSQLHQKDYVPIGTPLITVKNIGENKIIDDKIDFVSNQDKERLSKYILQEGDIVFSRVGYVDRRAYITQKENGWMFSGSTLRIRVKESSGLDSKFLSYYFGQPSFKQEIINMSVGATRPSLNTQLLEETDISLPPLPEQRAIASILSSLDDKIDLLQRENKTLEAMAETLFRQWFIEEAKDEWEEVPLSEVTKIAIGRTPPRKESHWFSTDPKDVKWVSIKDLGQSEVFVFDTSEYLKQEAVENFNIPIIPADTVLLSFKMTVGRVGITTEPMVSNEAIAHFKFDDNTPFSKEYLYIFLKTFKYESLGSTSSIVTAINSSMIKDIEIIIPDDITMNVFRTYTEPLFSKIKANIYQIRTLEKLRNTLLPKLMSGEVRIQY